jgi:O-antigen/teichoic acid export membrane protein
LDSETNIDNSSHTREVAVGAVVNLAGNLGRLSHFAFDIIAARVLGQTVFGYFSTTWFVINLSFIFCYFGAQRLVIDFVAKNKSSDEDEYYRGILSCIILSYILSGLLVVFVYLFAHDIALFLNKPPIEGYLKILCWSGPFYCTTTILLSATRGIKIMKFWVYVRSVAEPFADLMALCAAFVVFNSLNAPYYAKIVGFVSGALLAGYFFQRYFSLRRIFRCRPSVSNWKRTFAFGLPVMFADFLSMVTLKVDLIPLSILAPSAQVAMFQVVLNIANTMRNIPQATDPIMMPVVVEMRLKNNAAALENIYVTIIRITLFLSCGFFVLMSVFGSTLLSAYGSDFTYAASALTLTCLGIAIHTVFSTIEPVLVMSGFPYVNLLNSLFFVTVNLTVDFLLIPRYGIMGAAVGCFTACTLTAFIQIAQVYLKLGLKPLRWNLLGVFVLGGIFFAVFKSVQRYLVTNEFQLTIQIVGIVFFGILYLLVGWNLFLKTEERTLFRTVFRRK